MHKITPNKKFGQNFLTDQSVLERIVSSAGKLENKVILEIGGGSGNLTKHLIKAKPKNLIVVEIDKDYVESLSKILQSSSVKTTLISENILKTVMLFEAASGNVGRIVWASSSSVYGGAEFMPTPESERGKILPKSPYAWQKFAIEDYAKIACELYDLDIVCLRYFNVFGPGQMGDSPYSTAVAAWCHAAKNNLPLRSDGDGEQTRDMCYIANTVHANILAANSDIEGGFKGRCYNVACGTSVSNNEILEHFTSRFDVKINHAPERPGDVKHTMADLSRIQEELGYKPLITFWEGLEMTIDWWEI